MLSTVLTISAFIVAISTAILLWQIIRTNDKTTKVLSADLLSVQCLALTFLLAFYGLGNVALQFGFAISLLGFISTIILSHLVKS